MQNDNGVEQEQRSLPVPVVGPGRDYGDALARAGQAANAYVQARGFDSYQATISQGTREAQFDDLTLFSRFLEEMADQSQLTPGEAASLKRTPEELFHDPEAWRGMTAALLLTFREWLLYKQPEVDTRPRGRSKARKDPGGDQLPHPRPKGEVTVRGYRVTSVKRRMSTVRQYCRLATLSGAIPGDEWQRIAAVKGDSRAAAANIDADREQRGIVSQMVERKQRATPVSWEEFKRLMHTTTGNPAYREHDEILAERDTLLVCLLGEHGLRVGEAVALNIESINLRAGLIVVKRPKTHDDDNVLPLLPATLEAAELYLALLASRGEGQGARTSGPLFLGYGGERITRQAIYLRVKELGMLAGIPDLSPHDLRKFFARNTFERGNPINVIQRFGGWRSGHMPLHYGKLYGRETGVLRVGTEKEAGEQQ